MLASSSSYITLNMSYFDNNSAGHDGGVIIADTTNNLNGYKSLLIFTAMLRVIMEESCI